MSFSSFPLKALAFSLILASTTGLAFAQDPKAENYKGEAPCPPPLSLKDGFYVGAQVGYDSFRVRQDLVVSPGEVGNPVINPTGWVGGVFLGYGHSLTDLFYIGGEVFGNYSDASTSYNSVNTFGTYHDSFTPRASFGVAILPGIKITNTLLGYIPLGYNWANMRSNENLSGVSFSKTRTNGGWSYGVGLENLIFENWSLRSQYTHTKYRHFSSSISTFYPSDNQFELGLVYHLA